MKTRKEVLEQAFDECIREMYLRSDPPIDINEIDFNTFKDDEKNPFRSQHLIDSDQFDEVLEDTLYAYGIKDDFRDNLELIKQDLEKGPLMRLSKYEYDQLAPLSEVIGQESFDMVIKYLDTILKFYRTDHEVSQFRMSVCLGPSPDYKDGNKLL